MDIWFYYDVTHGLHAYCNPVSEEGVRDLEAVLDLQPGDRLLDIASGLGEMLVGFAERRGIRGVGVDVSPYAVRRAEAKRQARVPDADLEFVEGPGEAYRPDAPFDVAMCVGASWIWKGYEGTLKALVERTRPGGLVVTGEPYWRAEPPASYLQVCGLRADEVPTLHEYADTATRHGLTVLWMRGASEQEWDRYEMLQLASLDAFARENPDHPDLPHVRAKLLPEKEAYFRWGRSCLGFALWVFRTPAHASQP